MLNELLYLTWIIGNIKIRNHSWIVNAVEAYTIIVNKNQAISTGSEN